MSKLRRLHGGLGSLRAQEDFGFAQFPVEQVVHSRVHAFQIGFASEAIARLGEPPETVRYEPSSRGLRIFGKTEMALAAPAQRLIAWYGEDISIGLPEVRYRTGQVTEEPVMSVMVQGPRELAFTIRNDLVRRGAEAIDTILRPNAFVARTQAPQRVLLGYPNWLWARTGGRGEVIMRLSHYAPISREPDPEAA